jgi:predicted DNA-binding ribbon-helix-helix protein
VKRERKHSLAIAGHRTSISLEEPFWVALKEIAGAEGVTLAALVAEVDSRRGDANLSSALRLHVLAHYQRLAAMK